jgi:putative nucleotidyltransferase with HDIG domain
MNATLDQMVEQLDTIGTVPTSVAQIFGLINDPRSGAGDFERVVRPDVGLTANLLRCANSVFYRGSREITSVRDAINRMGMRRVFEVAASASFVKAIPATLTGYGLTSESYWSHSVAVAVLADRVGRKVGFTYPDLAFTAGLLHDLGKVVVASFLTSSPASPVDLPAGGLTTVEVERASLGTDHCELGEQLCVRWNLPKEISGASRWHHEPSGAPTATLRYLATVIQVADAAAHAAGHGAGEAFSRAVREDALERLNLEPAHLAELVAAAAPEIERTSQLLSGSAGRKAA